MLQYNTPPPTPRLTLLSALMKASREGDLGELGFYPGNRLGGSPFLSKPARWLRGPGSAIAAAAGLTCGEDFAVEFPRPSFP